MKAARMQGSRWFRPGLLCLVLLAFTIAPSTRAADEEDLKQPADGEAKAMHRADPGRSGWFKDALGPRRAGDVETILYVGGEDGHVFAVDAEKGELLWKFKTEAPVVGAPAAQGGLVFFGSTDKRLYALNARTGEKAWTLETGWAFVNSPLSFGDMLYVSADKIYALSAKTGKALWSNHFEYEDRGGRQRAEVGSQVSPALAGNLLYVGFDSGRLHINAALMALRVDTGEKEWIRYFPRGGFESSPVIAGESLFVSANYTYALELESGWEMWHSEKFRSSCSPALAAGRILLNTDDHDFKCFDVVTGEELWNTPLGNAPVTGESFLTTLGRIVVCGARNATLYALDIETGGVLWTRELKDDASWTGAAARKDTIYTSGRDGVLRALVPKTAAERWTLDLRTPLTSPPSLAD